MRFGRAGGDFFGTVGPGSIVLNPCGESVCVLIGRVPERFGTEPASAERSESGSVSNGSLPTVRVTHRRFAAASREAHAGVSLPPQARQCRSRTGFSGRTGLSNGSSMLRSAGANRERSSPGMSSSFMGPLILSFSSETFLDQRGDPPSHRLQVTYGLFRIDCSRSASMSNSRLCLARRRTTIGTRGQPRWAIRMMGRRWHNQRSATARNVATR
jgi:hypothetical protein